MLDKRVRKVNKLIAEIAEGNINALDELYEETGGLLFIMAKKYLSDKSFAEDLVSEVYLNLVKTAKQIDINKNGLNWLFKTVHNMALTWNIKQQSIILEDIDLQEDLAEIFAENNLENKVDIIKALKQISEDDRKLLYKKYWEGLTVREIAALYGIPPSTIQYRIKNSLKIMKDFLV